MVRVPNLAFIERRDRGPLPRNVWDAPDQGVEGEGEPDSVLLVRGGDLSNILPLDLNLILNS
jgi:hypothetical protein